MLQILISYVKSSASIVPGTETWFSDRRITGTNVIRNITQTDGGDIFCGLGLSNLKDVSHELGYKIFCTSSSTPAVFVDETISFQISYTNGLCADFQKRLKDYPMSLVVTSNISIRPNRAIISRIDTDNPDCAGEKSCFYEYTFEEYISTPYTDPYFESDTLPLDFPFGEGGSGFPFGGRRRRLAPSLGLYLAQDSDNRKCGLVEKVVTDFTENQDLCEDCDTFITYYSVYASAEGSCSFTAGGSTLNYCEYIISYIMAKNSKNFDDNRVHFIAVFKLMPTDGADDNTIQYLLEKVFPLENVNGWRFDWVNNIKYNPNTNHIYFLTYKTDVNYMHLITIDYLQGDDKVNQPSNDFATKGNFTQVGDSITFDFYLSMYHMYDVNHQNYVSEETVYTVTGFEEATGKTKVSIVLYDHVTGDGTLDLSSNIFDNSTSIFDSDITITGLIQSPSSITTLLRDQKGTGTPAFNGTLASFSNGALVHIGNDYDSSTSKFLVHVFFEDDQYFSETPIYLTSVYSGVINSDGMMIFYGYEHFSGRQGFYRINHVLPRYILGSPDDNDLSLEAFPYIQDFALYLRDKPSGGGSGYPYNNFECSEDESGGRRNLNGWDPGNYNCAIEPIASANLDYCINENKVINWELDGSWTYKCADQCTYFFSNDGVYDACVPLCPEYYMESHLRLANKIAFKCMNSTDCDFFPFANDPTRCDLCPGDSTLNPFSQNKSEEYCNCDDSNYEYRWNEETNENRCVCFGGYGTRNSNETDDCQCPNPQGVYTAEVPEQETARNLAFIGYSCQKCPERATGTKSELPSLGNSTDPQDFLCSMCPGRSIYDHTENECFCHDGDLDCFKEWSANITDLSSFYDSETDAPGLDLEELLFRDSSSRYSLMVATRLAEKRSYIITLDTFNLKPPVLNMLRDRDNYYISYFGDEDSDQLRVVGNNVYQYNLINNGQRNKITYDTVNDFLIVVSSEQDPCYELVAASVRHDEFPDKLSFFPGDPSLFAQDSPIPEECVNIYFFYLFAISIGSNDNFPSLLTQKQFISVYKFDRENAGLEYKFNQTVNEIWQLRDGNLDDNRRRNLLPFDVDYDSIDHHARFNIAGLDFADGELQVYAASQNGTLEYFFGEMIQTRLVFYPDERYLLNLQDEVNPDAIWSRSQNNFDPYYTEEQTAVCNDCTESYSIKFGNYSDRIYSNKYYPSFSKGAMTASHAFPDFFKYPYHSHTYGITEKYAYRFIVDADVRQVFFDISDFRPPVRRNLQYEEDRQPNIVNTYNLRLIICTFEIEEVEDVDFSKTNKEYCSTIYNLSDLRKDVKKITYQELNKQYLKMLNFKYNPKLELFTVFLDHDVDGKILLQFKMEETSFTNDAECENETGSEDQRVLGFLNCDNAEDHYYTVSHVREFAQPYRHKQLTYVMTEGDFLIKVFNNNKICSYSSRSGTGFREDHDELSCTGEWNEYIYSVYWANGDLYAVIKDQEAIVDEQPWNVRYAIVKVSKCILYANLYFGDYCALDCPNRGFPDDGSDLSKPRLSSISERHCDYGNVKETCDATKYEYLNLEGTCDCPSKRIKDYGLGHVCYPYGECQGLDYKLIPEGSYITDVFECVETCPEGYFKDKFTQSCIDKCSDDSYFSEYHSRCMCHNPNEVFDPHMKRCVCKFGTFPWNKYCVTCPKNSQLHPIPWRKTRTEYCQCSPPLVYDYEENLCLCADRSKYPWIYENQVECKDVPQYGRLVGLIEVECDSNASLNLSLNTCDCHEGYHRVDGACVECPESFSLSPNLFTGASPSNSCNLCEEFTYFESSNNQCECNALDNRVILQEDSSNVCRRCPLNSVKSSQTCKCLHGFDDYLTDSHSCASCTGKVLYSELNKCEPCTDGSTYDEETNTCTCSNELMRWDPYFNSCSCPYGYVKTALEACGCDNFLNYALAVIDDTLTCHPCRPGELINEDGYCTCPTNEIYVEELEKCVCYGRVDSQMTDITNKVETCELCPIYSTYVDTVKQCVCNPGFKRVSLDGGSFQCQCEPNFKILGTAPDEICGCSSDEDKFVYRDGECYQCQGDHVIRVWDDEENSNDGRNFLQDIDRYHLRTSYCQCEIENEVYNYSTNQCECYGTRYSSVDPSNPLLDYDSCKLCDAGAFWNGESCECVDPRRIWDRDNNIVDGEDGCICDASSNFFPWPDSVPNGQRCIKCPQWANEVPNDSAPMCTCNHGLVYDYSRNECLCPNKPIEGSASGLIQFWYYDLDDRVTGANVIPRCEACPDLREFVDASDPYVSNYLANTNSTEYQCDCLERYYNPRTNTCGCPGGQVEVTRDENGEKWYACIPCPAHTIPVGNTCVGEPGWIYEFPIAKRCGVGETSINNKCVICTQEKREIPPSYFQVDIFAKVTDSNTDYYQYNYSQEKFFRFSDEAGQTGGQCLYCPEGAKSKLGSLENACDCSPLGNYIWGGKNNNRCIRCPSERERSINNACVECPSYQIAIHPTNTCGTCLNGQKIVGNSCKKCPLDTEETDFTTGACKPCPRNLHLDPVTRTCKTCHEIKPFHVTNGYACVYCAENYIYDTTDHACVRCDTSQGFYAIKSENICDKCPDGTIIDEKTNLCLSCTTIASLSYSDENRQKCIKCPFGMEYVESKLGCEYIYKDPKDCNDDQEFKANSCRKCQNSNAVYRNNRCKKKCTDPLDEYEPEGPYYLDFNVCRKCNEIKPFDPEFEAICKPVCSSNEYYYPYTNSCRPKCLITQVQQNYTCVDTCDGVDYFPDGDNVCISCRQSNKLFDPSVKRCVTRCDTRQSAPYPHTNLIKYSCDSCPNCQIGFCDGSSCSLVLTGGDLQRLELAETLANSPNIEVTNDVFDQLANYIFHRDLQVVSNFTEQIESNDQRFQTQQRLRLAIARIVQNSVYQNYTKGLDVEKKFQSGNLQFQVVNLTRNSFDNFNNTECEKRLQALLGSKNIIGIKLLYKGVAINNLFVEDMDLFYLDVLNRQVLSLDQCIEAGDRISNRFSFPNIITNQTILQFLSQHNISLADGNRDIFINQCANLTNKTYNTDVDFGTRADIRPKFSVVCGGLECQLEGITNDNNNAICSCHISEYLNITIKSEEKNFLPFDSAFYKIWKCPFRFDRNHGFIVYCICIGFLLLLWILFRIIQYSLIPPRAYEYLRENSSPFYKDLSNYKDILEYCDKAHKHQKDIDPDISKRLTQQKKITSFIYNKHSSMHKKDSDCFIEQDHLARKPFNFST